jgi:hypothetical protein
MKKAKKPTRILAYNQKPTSLVLLCIILFAAFGTYRLFISNAAPVAVTAKQADSFIETIGVAAHIKYQANDTNLLNNVFLPKLCEMGVRYVRDGGSSPAFYDFVNKSYQQCGIKWVMVVDPRDGYTPQNVADKGILPIIDAIWAVEGPNEWDINPNACYGGLCGSAGAAKYQNELYTAIKNHSDARVRNVKVLAPSMAHPSNSPGLGVVSCDYATMHNYQGGPNLPDDQLFSGKKWIASAQSNCNKPVVATENGYCEANSTVGWCNEPSRALAKYTTRIYLENYLAGVYRNHIYNFSTYNPNTNWTIFFNESNGNATNPAYDAVKNMITLLKDPGASFTPGTLSYEFVGDKTNLKTLLLQKRDGKFYLVTWLNDYSVTDRTSHNTDRDVSRSLQLNLASAMNAKIFRPTSSGITPVVSHTANASFPVDVRDEITIIELSTTTATPPPTSTTQPDLIVTDIIANPTNPQTGQPVTFSAVVKNQGTGATPAGTTLGVKFTIPNGASTWSDTYTSALAAGASVTLTANGGSSGSSWVPAAAGSYSVTAHVDDVNRISNELNEANNMHTEAISVGATTTPTPITKQGDLNGDGKVNIYDLSKLLTKFNKTGTATDGDLNGDGQINDTDMSILLSKWGS